MSALKKALQEAGVKGSRELMESYVDQVIGEIGGDDFAGDRSVMAKRLFTLLSAREPELLYDFLQLHWNSIVRQWFVEGYYRRRLRTAGEAKAPVPDEGQWRDASPADMGAKREVPQGHVSAAPGDGAGQKDRAREGHLVIARPVAAPSPISGAALAGLKAVSALRREWLLEEAARFARENLGKNLEACVREEVIALSGRSDKLSRFYAQLAGRMASTADPLGRQLQTHEVAALARALQMENRHEQ